MTVLLALLIGALTFAATLFVAGRRASGGLRRRISDYVDSDQRTQAAPEPLSTSRFARVVRPGEDLLRRIPGWSRFEALVDRAGTMPATRLGLATAGGAVLLALLTTAADGSPVMGLGAAICLPVLVRVWLGLKIKRRRRAFDGQLPDLLADLASALSAGHSLHHALQSVASDTDAPAGAEFNRALDEARLGRPLEEALGAMAARVASRDLDFVLDVIVVQRQVGGSLAGLFTMVGETVRERHQFALRVRALTAMGRLSAIVLLAVPVVFALVLSLRNPHYLAPLVRTKGTREVTGFCLTALAVGMFWLRSIVRIQDARS